MAFSSKESGKIGGKGAEDFPCLVKQIFNEKSLMKKSVFMLTLSECMVSGNKLKQAKIDGRLISDLYYDFVPKEEGEDGGILRGKSLSDVHKITLDRGLKGDGSTNPDHIYKGVDRGASYAVTLKDLLARVREETRDGTVSTRMVNKEHYVAVRDHLNALTQ